MVTGLSSCIEFSEVHRQNARWAQGQEHSKNLTKLLSQVVEWQIEMNILHNCWFLYSIEFVRFMAN